MPCWECWWNKFSRYGWPGGLLSLILGPYSPRLGPYGPWLGPLALEGTTFKIQGFFVPRSLRVEANGQLLEVLLSKIHFSTETYSTLFGRSVISMCRNC